MMSKTSIPISFVSQISRHTYFPQALSLHIPPSRLAKRVQPPMLQGQSMPQKKVHDKTDLWERTQKPSPQIASSRNPDVKTAGPRKASKIFSYTNRNRDFQVVYFFVFPTA
jgi:hypothetical protein